MTYSLYIAGMGFSGKTALCLGLYSKFQEMGLRVGYFKPIGQGMKIVDGKPRDPDVLLLKDVMEMEESLDVLNPVVLGKRYLDHILKDCQSLESKIRDGFEKTCKNKDILLIESPTIPELLTCCDLDIPRFSCEFGSKILFSFKGEDDSVVEKAILYKRYLEQKGGKALGVVLNFVPLQQVERMRGIVSSVLERCGLRVLGIVPDHRDLTNPIVYDIVEALGAEVLTCEDKLDNVVEDYIVGAMTPESAMTWLRRSMGRALITGGDRTDLVLTAIETKPSAIILTGNIYPSKSVLITAEEKSIPVLLVPDDTYTTVTKLEFLTGRIVPSPKSSKKIQLTKKIISEYVNWKMILDDYVESKPNKPKA